MTERVTGAWVSIFVALIGSWSCVDDRERPTVPVFGELFVSSDPSGAEIRMNGQLLEGTTPRRLTQIPSGRQFLELRLEAGPAGAFVWADSVEVPETGLDTVTAALEGGCARDCPFELAEGRVRCRLNGRGDTCAGTFFSDGVGLQWPGARGDYAAGGRLLASAILGEDAGARAGDTVATLVFRQSWIGRAPVEERASGRRQSVTRRYWASSLRRPAPFLGLVVDETIIAVDSADAQDVLLLDYRVHNISARPEYRRIYPEVPPGGFTFRSLFLGFALDADVGVSGDDLGTFDPELGLGFLYDADLRDEELGDRADRPALVGLVPVDPPAGADRRTLTMWRAEDDWDDGLRLGFAWRLLAGRLAASDPLDDHASDEIGFAPQEMGDHRVTLTFGPLRLAPGDSTTFAVALVLAEPVAGAYTPGVTVASGDPTDGDRQILEVAGDLRDLAGRTDALWERYGPR